MDYVIKNQIKDIIQDIYHKEVKEDHISLLSSIYGFEPRDIILIIGRFSALNDITLNIVPYWDVTQASISEITDYCRKLLQLNKENSYAQSGSN